jgi:putative FmdB family regulatory protein
VPVYEYRCVKCETHFEELVRAAGEPPSCPACGSADVARLFSPFGTKWRPSRVKWNRVG